jgi:hypothetical protein
MGADGPLQASLRRQNTVQCHTHTARQTACLNPIERGSKSRCDEAKVAPKGGRIGRTGVAR